MKKVLMAVLMVLMFSTMVWAATPMTFTKVLYVGANNSIQKIVFNNTSDTVLDNATETFKLDLGSPNSKGAIKEIYFESSSTNCNVWLSEVDEALATASETIIYMTGINLGFSPELSANRYYINRDSVMGNYLYLTIKAVAGGGATGDWDFIITKEKL
jgi:hypothetical protein